MINIRRSPDSGNNQRSQPIAHPKFRTYPNSNPYRYKNAPVIKPIPPNCIRHNRGRNNAAIDSTRHLQDIIQNSHHHQKHQDVVAPVVKGPKFKVSITGQHQTTKSMQRDA
ncbi:hypothetical protein Nepgr_015854 [Nepenthes gracilis]|uniref:Uncharacterized protein n=1 Tax=Nepenthes gracilis TaxID=150966 RepID=A0AAD3SLQ6_NEPGR|nr:hypothetical protein Nepgr_015854 [Nepenthes gracilis]